MYEQVTELATVKRPQERAFALQQWQESGGVMIMGYEMYRNLTQGRNIKSKKLKETFQKTLVDPGAVPFTTILSSFVGCRFGHYQWAVLNRMEEMLLILTEFFSYIIVTKKDRQYCLISKKSLCNTT